MAATRDGMLSLKQFRVDLEKSLGEGGFGTVYLAKDNTNDPPTVCAAKKVPVGAKTDRENYAAELDTLKRVHGHPSVIRLLGEGERAR